MRTSTHSYIVAFLLRDVYWESIPIWYEPEREPVFPTRYEPEA
jgi:hypothetical protein